MDGHIAQPLRAARPARRKDGLPMTENRYTGRPAESFGFRYILYDKRDGVARVTSNRPEVFKAKLPEVTRYTRQQLNFWRDFSWHLTVGHARDWLAIHNASAEVHEGVRAFAEKRRPDYEGVHRQWAEDASPEYDHGAPVASCPHCGAVGLPAAFRYCGQCGQPLGEV
jgi:hypothetical protein